jgi:sec-independent protein translocase protein TatA
VGEPHDGPTTTEVEDTMGMQELIVVLVILLLLFGAKKLPELAGSMGKSIKEFRKATDEADADADDTSDTAS